MMAEPTANEPMVRFTITQEQHRVTAVTTNALEVNHFLDFIRLSRAYNTWVSYAFEDAARAHVAQLTRAN